MLSRNFGTKPIIYIMIDWSPAKRVKSAFPDKSYICILHKTTVIFGRIKLIRSKFYVGYVLIANVALIKGSIWRLQLYKNSNKSKACC